jgi:hypothetical protein
MSRVDPGQFLPPECVRVSAIAELFDIEIYSRARAVLYSRHSTF